jgi:chitodextrinase
MGIIHRVDCATKARYLIGAEWSTFFDAYGQSGDDHPWSVGSFAFPGPNR